MRSALFWIITKHSLVNSYRLSDQPIDFIFKGQVVKEELFLDVVPESW